MSYNLGAQAKLPKQFGNNWSDPFFKIATTTGRGLGHCKKQVLNQSRLGIEKEDLLSSAQSRTVDGPPDVTAPSALKLYRAYMNQQAGLDCDISSERKLETGAAAVGVPKEEAALKFYAYYEENVQESAVENYRMRLVTITLFPNDNQIMIQEPRVPNNGLLGGMMLKKQRVPLSLEAARAQAPVHKGMRLPDLSNVPKWTSAKDFNVRSSVVMHGFRFFIYGCDDAARTYLTQVEGKKVPSNLPPPEDAYMTVFRPTRIDGSKKSERKNTIPGEYMFDIHEGSSQEAVRTQRFFRDGGKVLRFFAKWKDMDTEPIHGVWRFFEILYFVEDDTVSIIERHNPAESQAEGGDFSKSKLEVLNRTFLSRRRIPRDCKMTALRSLAEDGFLSAAKDFAVGTRLKIYGREFYLYACDMFTRDFYLNNFQQRMAPDENVENSGSSVNQQHSKKIVGSLVLKPPKRDTTMWEKYSGEILRYKLRFHAPETEDALLRAFILPFYLEDGTIMVSDVAQRNTGFPGGKFLRKDKYRKRTGLPVSTSMQVGGEHSAVITHEDLVPGTVINISEFQFFIEDADEHTKSFLAKDQKSTGGCNSTVDPQRVALLLKAFGDYIVCRYANLTEAFRALDKNHDGYISLNEIRESLTISQIAKCDEELVALIMKFDANHDGRITYRDFMAAVGDKVCQNRKASSLSLSVEDEENLPQEAEQCRNTNLSADAQRTRFALMKNLKEKLEGRYFNCVEMFRMFSTQPRAYNKLSRTTGKSVGHVELAALTNCAKDAVITPVQFRRGVTEVLGLIHTPSEMSSLLQYFFPLLPAAQFDSRSDEGLYAADGCSLTLQQFQSKLIEMSQVGQLCRF